MEKALDLKITRQEILHDIEMLPDQLLPPIKRIIQEFLIVGNTIIAKDSPRPVYGSGKGKMWFAEDFDDPIEGLEEYM